MEQWKLVVAGGAIAILGIVAGAVLFRSEPASAQTGGFRECFIARQESVDTNGSGRIQEPTAGHMIAVPPGFTVVGGGGLMGNWVGAIVLCR